MRSLCTGKKAAGQDGLVEIFAKKEKAANTAFSKMQF